MAAARDDLEDAIREHVYPAVRGEDDVEGVGDALDSVLAILSGHFIRRGNPSAAEELLRIREGA